MKKKYLFIILGIIQFFVGAGAVIPGIMLILDPSGLSLQFPSEMLNNAPFHNFIIPGIILLLINGAGQIAAGILSFRKHPLSGYAGTVFGLGLMIWIFVQVNFINGGHFLQYSYFALGLIETALAFLIQDNIASMKKR